MTTDFHATIKLVSGEEIFSIVTPHKENNTNFLILYEPVVITEVKTSSGIYGYKIEPWLKTADDDTFLIERDKIITISESKDAEIILYHKKYIIEKNKRNTDHPNEETLTKEQGYISNIQEMKNKLEKIFKQSLRD